MLMVEVGLHTSTSRTLLSV